MEQLKLFELEEMLPTTEKEMQKYILSCAKFMIHKGSKKSVLQVPVIREDGTEEQLYIDITLENYKILEMILRGYKKWALFSHCKWFLQYYGIKERDYKIIDIPGVGKVRAYEYDMINAISTIEKRGEYEKSGKLQKNG